jgi:hypothetical protein
LINPDCFACYKSFDGTIEGLYGSYFEGLRLKIRSFHSSWAQVGVGANGKNKEPGFFFWFDWHVEANSNEPVRRISMNPSRLGSLKAVFNVSDTNKRKVRFCLI